MTAVHRIVYRRPGRYAGWPANYGIWSWGDEIVVGFTLGHMGEGGFHPRDRSRPFQAMQARSIDGGLSWAVEPTPCRAPGDRGLSADEHMAPELHVGPAAAAIAFELPPDDLDLSHPHFALMAARSGLRAGAHSWFYTSTDRCRSWQGPYPLPMFGQLGIAARTDYLVEGPRRALLFLTATKTGGEEGRVFCTRTADGGRTFSPPSWIGPEYEGFSIMPASVRLPDGRLLAALRCRGPAADWEQAPNWIDLYRSEDEGASWRFLNRPVESTGHGGNPPALLRLRDGRLCLTYGYRDRPYGMRAVLSEDEGRTWSPPVVLREDGGNHDVGYPRTVQRSDGALVTVYYFNDQPSGERYVAATIWRP